MGWKVLKTEITYNSNIKSAFSCCVAVLYFSERENQATVNGHFLKKITKAGERENWEKGGERENGVRWGGEWINLWKRRRFYILYFSTMHGDQNRMGHIHMREKKNDYCHYWKHKFKKMSTS